MALRPPPRTPSEDSPLGDDLVTAALLPPASVTRHSLRGEESPFTRRVTVNLRGQVAKHVLQNAAVLIVVELLERIDTADQRHALEAAVRRDDLGEEPLMRLEIAMQAADRHLLVALQPQRLPRSAFFEHQRNDAHAD